ncbi:DUF2225 domain-containing protein [Gottschalkia acidurici]|nr:DUF2225 domain-containing protein [Gottschalkia acidurici]
MIYSKKLTCPVCGNKFTSMKSMDSKLRVERIDSDFLTHYRGETIPLKYSVFVCPKCGYSAVENSFDNMNTRKKQIIKDEITKKWVEKDYTKERTMQDAIMCYKLALYCGEVLQLKKVELASICLKIAWLYRINNDENEKRFLKLSVELYEKSYSEEESNMDELTLIYLIGNLYMRIGDIDQATNWMGKVISNPYIKSNPKIEKLSREQWGIIKENRNN